MNNFVDYLLRYGIISGVMVTLLLYIADNYSSKMAGFIYGAIPYTFIIIASILYFKGQKTKILHMSETGYLGGFFFIVSMASFYFPYRAGLNFWLCIVLACLNIAIMVWFLTKMGLKFGF